MVSFSLKRGGAELRVANLAAPIIVNQTSLGAIALKATPAAFAAAFFSRNFELAEWPNTPIFIEVKYSGAPPATGAFLACSRHPA